MTGSHHLLRTFSRFFLGILGLTLGLLSWGWASPALAVEPPSIISPTNNGVAELVQDGQGNWYARVTVSTSGEYIASWEKRSGVWATPQEAVSGLADVSQCRQGTISQFFNRYPTKEELYSHFEFNADGSWQSQKLQDEIQYACVANAEWTDSQTLGSFDENGNWVVDIPLSKMGPGSHVVFLMGVSYVGTSFDPACGREFEDGSWVGYDCIASYSAPAYFQINIPLPPSDSGVLGGISVAAGSFFHNSIFSDLPTLDLENFFPKFAAAAGVTVVLAIMMSIPTSLMSRATGDGIALLSRYRFFRWILGTVSGFWAVVIMFIGAFIAGFADPSFGVNWTSVRMFLTIFVAFAVMDYGAVFVAWLVTKKHYGTLKPEVTAKPIFLLVIAATVFFARLTELDPTLIFGAVIALDLGGRLAKNVEAIATVVSTVYVLTVGMLAWYLYSYLTTLDPMAFSSTSLNATEIINIQGWLGFGQVTLGEWLSVFTVTAISTIPIALLPFEGFGGKLIFEWKKWVWIALYAVGLALYLTVFFPTDAAWDTSNRPLVAWVTIFVIYIVVGFVLVSLISYLKKRKDRQDSQASSQPRRESFSSSQEAAESGQEQPQQQFRRRSQ